VSLITLTTDFGTSDPFVGIMKGVILGRAPGTTIVDVAHGIPPQDVRAGALVLRHAIPYFPAGAIHVAVVDPGVGGSRRALCVETSSGMLVGPDNGLLSLAAPPAEVRRIVELADERFFLSPRSATFHGRDVFAPVAAALATGTPVAALGPELSEMERVSLPAAVRRGSSLRGEVVYVDHFGNLVTNVDEPALDNFPRQGVSITIGSVRLRGIAPSYSTVPPGEPVAVLNSWGLLEIAVRDGSAAGRLGVGRGAPVVVE
jgi:S-adenosylmethionine hydrolase